MSRNLVAEERATYIERAIREWRSAIAADGAKVGLGGRPAYWNETFGYWAFFGRTSANTAKGSRYWNTFGTEPEQLRKNMLVEINPPESGIARGTQGLIGLDSKGARWILHGGRIHPGKERIDTTAFGRLSGLKTVLVRFSDGSTRDYYPVAPLDVGSEALHAALGSFIERCGYVRTRFLHGEGEANLDSQVADGEGSSKPEKKGNYAIPPRGQIEAERIHADVWKVLAAALDARGIAHSNSRVGRYGPDLRTRTKPLVLFEIKPDTTARSVYEALGQLLVYERLLQKRYTKVLVVPGVPPARLATVLKDYEVRILIYAKAGRTFTLNVSEIDGIPMVGATTGADS